MKLILRSIFIFLASVTAVSVTQVTSAATPKNTSVYLAKGSGVNACPANTMCLYADADYNGANYRTSILVIPSGAQASDFAIYGFDHSSDGVSAVVNNTNHETGLVAGLYLTGEVLKIPAGEKISNLTNLPLGTGTWNDAAKSALSLPVLQATMSMTLRGPKKAHSGAEVSYIIETRNSGPDSVADAIVETSIPSNLSDVKVVCQAKKASCGKALVGGARQPISLEKNGQAMVTVSGKIAADFVGSMSISSSVKSSTVVNTAGNSNASLTTTVEKSVEKNLNANANLVGSWGDWESGGQIYSYRINMTAEDTDVRRWIVSFDGLPTGVTIHNKATLWTEVIKDGVDGEIILSTPAKGTYIVEAGKSLDIDLQLLYPSQNEAYKKLQNLTAIQLK